MTEEPQIRDVFEQWAAASAAKDVDASMEPIASSIVSFETRVFQKTDSRWQMIHQHVSFPTDPATGMAVTELQP